MTNTQGEDFRSLLNSEGRGDSDITAETSKAVNEETESMSNFRSEQVDEFPLSHANLLDFWT